MQRFLSALALVLMVSCSEKKEATPTSGTSDVEYKLESTTATRADYITYLNETGGTTNVQQTPLPASFRFKKNWKKGDVLVMQASAKNATATTSITGSILIDGKVVNTATGRGEDASTNVRHQF